MNGELDLVMCDNILGIEDFSSEELRIKISSGENDSEVRVDFIGSFQSDYLENSIDEYLPKLHESIKENNKKLVRLSFEKLTYLDSRSLGTLIAWIKSVAEDDLLDQYSIYLYFNKDLMVHQTSFLMLKELFPDIIEIKTIIED